MICVAVSTIKKMRKTSMNSINVTIASNAANLAARRPGKTTAAEITSRDLFGYNAPLGYAFQLSAANIL
jgi:hypothetical protein